MIYSKGATHTSDSFFQFANLIAKLPIYTLKLYYGYKKKKVKYVKGSRVDHDAAVLNMQVYIRYLLCINVCRIVPVTSYTTKAFIPFE